MKRYFIGKSVISSCLFKVLCLLLITSHSVTAAEAESPSETKQKEELGLLNFTVGRINVSRGDNSSQQYGVEYRFKTMFRPWDFSLRPAIDFTVANDSAKYYYTDLKHDFYPGENWLITPSFGVGYFKSSKEIKLGSKLEFRSGVEFAYEFKNRVRAGIAIFHLSNASTAKNNPGTEVAVFSLSIPMFNN
jgi:hypothetical protein